MKTRAASPMTVKLELSLRNRLKNLSDLKQRTIHWLMKKAIIEYIEHEEQTEKLKQETLDRWKQEAECNKLINNEDVMTWLDAWGTDHETGRP